jgi:hypothetical protein
MAAIRIVQEALEPCADNRAYAVDGRCRALHRLPGLVLGDLHDPYAQPVAGLYPGSQDHDLFSFFVDGAHDASVSCVPSPARDRKASRTCLLRLLPDTIAAERSHEVTVRLKDVWINPEYFLTEA